MEVENEHLAEVAHLRVLRVRRKGREVFCLDAVTLDREGVHQHCAEAPLFLIVTDTDMVVELAVLQSLAPEVIAARGHLAEEQQGPQRALLAWGVSCQPVHAHETGADTRIEMLVRVGIAKRDVLIGERRNRENQFVLQQANLHTRSHLQTMETAVVGVSAYRVRLTVN